MITRFWTWLGQRTVAHDLRRCPECHALILHGDETKHAKHHDRLIAVEKRLRSADETAELLRRVVMDYGDCDHPDTCDCSAAMAHRHRNP